jgi:secernin
MVVVPEKGPVWFAKNSDREPSEAQFLECHDESAERGIPAGLSLDSARLQTIVSRPAWMWGCEMGVNEYGVAIGNEAVFTKIPVPKSGYTGMDFQRVALTNNRTADEALEHLCELTEQLTQGGVMGHRHHRFRYHSSFLIADSTTAWVLETAGNYWAAKRVVGGASISNALTIEDDFDSIHTGAYPLARERGWVKSARGFGFASAFSNPVMSALAGARIRRACTARALADLGEPSVPALIAALSDHGAVEPGKGLRSESPCAHASWLPTRTAAQTTASIIARLDSSGPTVWATGTSSPCLSVFKPAPFDSTCRPDPSRMRASTNKSSGGLTSSCIARVSPITGRAESPLPKTWSVFRTTVCPLRPMPRAPGASTGLWSTNGSHVPWKWRHHQCHFPLAGSGRCSHDASPKSKTAFSAPRCSL